MCDYCEREKPIFEIPITDRTCWGWGGDVKISLTEAEEYTHIIFIDRGFVRSAMKHDCQCMDHGEKVKITFCPFCGRELSGGVEQQIHAEGKL